MSRDPVPSSPVVWPNVELFEEQGVGRSGGRPQKGVGRHAYQSAVGLREDDGRQWRRAEEGLLDLCCSFRQRLDLSGAVVPLDLFDHDGDSRDVAWYGWSDHEVGHGSPAAERPLRRWARGSVRINLRRRGSPCALPPSAGYGGSGTPGRGSTRMGSGNRWLLGSDGESARRRTRSPVRNSGMVRQVGSQFGRGGTFMDLWLSAVLAGGCADWLVWAGAVRRSPFTGSCRTAIARRW